MVMPPVPLAPSRLAALLGAAFIVIYLLPLGARPLARPDEVRYGAIAKEMVRSGDWTTPTLNGVRYFEKPVLGYWLDAAALKLLGPNAFALRLPSALATGLTALIVFVLTLQFADRRTAFLAGGIFLTTLEVIGVGTFAVLDSVLSMFLTATVAAFYAAHRSRVASRRRWLLLLSGGAAAGAFLTKGFLALAIPVIVLVPYLAAERRWRDMFTAPWLSVLAALLLVLPWAVLIHLREPDFWHYFFWVEHVQRFLGTDAQHAEPVWYYFVNLLWAGLPWIWLLPAAIAGLRESSVDRSFLKLAAWWAVMPLLFFTLARGKLITYVLPCFAPLSVLLAAGLERYAISGRQRSFRGAALLLGALFAAGLTLLALAQAGVLGRAVYGPVEPLRLGIVVAAWVGGLACAAAAFAGRSANTRLAAVAGTGLALFLPVNVALPERVRERIAPGPFIERLEPVPDTAIVISDAPTFGSVAYFLNRDDVYVVSPGEIEYGLSYPQDRDRYLDDGRLPALLNRNIGRREILIICETGSEARFRGLLPASAERTERGELVAWRIERS
jgi:4-amino-4-deoxy-L-arabinose transferase